ncbi:MAG TPA: hypothetical protein VE869_16770 [Gemmatimonas sp.]|nr:hypothetical protein [Gemmatimonas sp.]
MTSPSSPSGAIAGSVLPIRRAEELIATLQGVLSVRIVPSDSGSIEEIHVLTTDAVLPKQTVRNIESALMAQLGLRVNHRKISIATTLDTPRALDPAPPPSRTGSQGAYVPPVESSSSAGPTSGPFAGAAAGESGGPAQADIPGVSRSTEESSVAVATPVMGRRAVPVDVPNAGRRALIFEDVEVRRSRSRGVMCKVTLGRDGEDFIGEAEGQESERSRIELAARATLLAIVQAMRVPSGAERSLALEGSKLIDAFEREFIFVSVAARIGRESVLLTGSCEVRESAETSAVLAVLDATNRWMHLDR